ncbi:DUF983 domain-containing protein [Paracoccus sulfuroxidans]|uniref:Uncharacterized protein (DUF983 family) n=1 Tax=Paracoccus sulfuroxidans TaxID=384678 RepID=A0A562P2Q2_9RHOB|nr:DUF983 domain-containing protein [Paracoccus sulfuroxidans]TWI38266.1 uncharacterized protein (DUF983 family) [Paracoccus sulfuroxidans]
MSEEIRDSRQAIRRGVMNRCPKCGQGKVFAGYLQLVPRCSNCGEPIGEYRAADGPAFFTMTVVMLLLIPMIGFGWVLFRPEPVVLLLWVGVISTVLTLVLLRLIKGGFIGYLWAKNERDRGA